MKRNILTFLLSLAIAFGVWLYVITVVSPNSDNTYHGVSVVLQGESVLEERGLMITTRQIPTVSLRLEGNRSELQKLNSSNISVTVDVSKITEPGEHPLTISPNNVRLPGDVSYSAITVASRNPDAIKLEVKERGSDSVSVVIHDNGTTPTGFFADIDNAVLDYEQIEISGPVDVIENIKMARIEMNLTNKNGTVSESLAYTLCDAEGQPVDAELVTTNTGAVNVTLQIMPVKQIGLSLNVIDGGGATKETCTLEMEVDSISVYGTEEVLQNLETHVLGTVDLSQLPEDTTLVLPVVLPEGVGNNSGIDEVIVKVSFPDLRTKTLDITNFSAVNVPVGKKAEITTEKLQIQFRGPKELIENMKPEHITVNVDFTDAQNGTATMPVTVSLSEEYAQVGTIDTYTVSATLK